MSPEQVQITRDIVQIFFFIIVAVVTVLTYLKAKKTLLQPIRTEIFKEQLKAFSEILGFFIGKKEAELRDDFVFDELLEANSILLLDTYASFFFGIEIDETERSYSNENCPTGIISREVMEDQLVIADNFLINEDMPNSTKPETKNKAEIWAKYKYGMIKIPKKYSEKLAEFHKIMDSPLLTKKLYVLIEEYTQIIDNNTVVLFDILSECAQELPEKYPTFEYLKKGSIYWIQSRYIDRIEHLEPKAVEITKYLKEYYTVDKLLE